MPPQLLIAGHIVKDVDGDGWAAGGGVYYAAAQAVRLGVETAVVAVCESDIDPRGLVPEANWRVTHVKQGIRFENVYTDGVRSQRVLKPDVLQIAASDIPAEWQDADIVLLLPVMHDIDPSLPEQLKREGNLLGIGAQGWLRRLDGDCVRPGEGRGDHAWLRGDVVFVSEEDLEEPDAVQDWCERVGSVVLTRGRRGCTVWDAGGRHDIPPAPAEERDATGAGDVFAAAYTVRYAETRGTLQAARFASAAAALCVEGPGISAIGDRAAIEARQAASEAAP